ncbi:MAG: EamA/RhaT family transporter [Clostridiaceae bacterium]|nr:EamA/RhaT family transporter [Clostridiaceae bacterium]
MHKVLNEFSQSIKKNIKGILLIIIAAIFTSVGQLFWKLSNGTEVKLVLIGFVCYGLGAVLMILAFRFGSLSVLHPFMSVGYIFAIILGQTKLHENISVAKYVAVAIIMLGVTFIGGGDV